MPEKELGTSRSNGPPKGGGGAYARIEPTHVSVPLQGSTQLAV